MAEVIEHFSTCFNCGWLDSRWDCSGYVLIFHQVYLKLFCRAKCREQLKAKGWMVSG